MLQFDDTDICCVCDDTSHPVLVSATFSEVILLLWKNKLIKVCPTSVSLEIQSLRSIAAHHLGI